MKILVVDRDECTGCCYCVDRLPAVFKLDAEGVSVVHGEPQPGDTTLAAVIDNCPAVCIHWRE